MYLGILRLNAQMILTGHSNFLALKYENFFCLNSIFKNYPQRSENNFLQIKFSIGKFHLFLKSHTYPSPSTTKVKKVNWVRTLFSASRGAHFTSNWPDYSMYNVALRGLPVLCTTSLLGQEEQVKVKCFAQGHNTRPAQGLNSGP